MIEILRTVINFLIALFSGELPIVYYVDYYPIPNSNKPIHSEF